MGRRCVRERSKGLTPARYRSQRCRVILKLRKVVHEKLLQSLVFELGLARRGKKPDPSPTPAHSSREPRRKGARPTPRPPQAVPRSDDVGRRLARSEEHTSELQSRRDLVCRLLLEKKKKNKNKHLRL